MQMEPRAPRYPWGLRVQALDDLFNDGSHPGFAPGAQLAAAGDAGAIVQIGHHTEANLPIYLVEFEKNLAVVGVMEEEIAPFGRTAATEPQP